jgi:hypothetical protein
MKENYVIQPFSNEHPSDITLQQMNEYNVFNNGNGNGTSGNNGNGTGGNNGNGHGHGVDGNQGNGKGNNPVPVGGESILFLFILSYLIFKIIKK